MVRIVIGAAQSVDRLGDQRLVLPVERTGGLVQDEQGRLAQQRARKRNALALATRKPHAPVADHRLEPQVEPLDEFAGMGGAQRGPQILVAGLRRGKAQVRRDRVMQKEHVLRHIGHLTAPATAIGGIDLDAVDENLAGGRLEQPEQHVGDRALA